VPWKLVHDHPACRRGEWAVVNQQAEAEGRHSIEGCHATREQALAQQRALYANEPQAASHEVPMMERQQLVAQVKQMAVSDDGPGEISGYASVYGNVDLQDDVVERGAFDRTIAHWAAGKSKVPLIDWHGDSLSRLIGSVAELKSTQVGLWFRAQFSSDPEAQSARRKAKEGHLTGVSIGYLPVKRSAKMVGDRLVQVLHEVRLLEVSLTPIPANPEAQLASVKSLGEAKAVSDTPWSNFTQADYTPEQWRRACLIDTGQGATDSKDRYKLPVREPSGALNRGGVHAAAGGHGVGAVQGVSPEKKRAAARALVGLYRGQLGEDPPPGLLRLAGESQASIGYEVFADAMHKALELPEPARKAAVDALYDTYHPVDPGPAGTDGTPQDPADPPPPADTPAAPGEDLHGYAERIIADLPRPPDRLPDPSTPEGIAAAAAQQVKTATTISELDRMRHEIDALLGKEQPV